eukprot:1184598-Prorocentrum_minimum.AAC.1
MNLPITPSEAVDPFACPPRPHRALTVHRYLSRHVSRCVRRQHGVRERLSGVARLAKDARGGRQAVTQPPHWHRRPRQTAIGLARAAPPPLPTRLARLRSRPSDRFTRRIRRSREAAGAGSRWRSTRRRSRWRVCGLVGALDVPGGPIARRAEPGCHLERLRLRLRLRRPKGRIY